MHCFALHVILYLLPIAILFNVLQCVYFSFLRFLFYPDCNLSAKPSMACVLLLLNIHLIFFYSVPFLFLFCTFSLSCFNTYLYYILILFTLPWLAVFLFTNIHIIDFSLTQTFSLSILFTLYASCSIYVFCNLIFFNFYLFFFFCFLCPFHWLFFCSFLFSFLLLHYVPLFTDFLYFVLLDFRELFLLLVLFFSLFILLLYWSPFCSHSSLTS